MFTETAREVGGYIAVLGVLLVLIGLGRIITATHRHRCPGLDDLVVDTSARVCPFCNGVRR